MHTIFFFILRITLLFGVLPADGGQFKTEQMRYQRVREAYTEKNQLISQMYEQKKLQPETAEIFIRAFKEERELEVWVRQRGSGKKWQLLVQYKVCNTSGELGPKRKQGDLQIPEGFYRINHFNPKSNFHLSLGINYPNASDRILSDRKTPGGAIYLHGSCVTIGCLPLTDDKIKELYILAVNARHAGQNDIQVRIFPFRLNDSRLREAAAHPQEGKHLNFWDNLHKGYKYFEEKGYIPVIQVNATGSYVFR